MALVPENDYVLATAVAEKEIKTITVDAFSGQHGSGIESHLERRHHPVDRKMEQHHHVAVQYKVQSSLRANFARRKASCYPKNDAVRNEGAGNAICRNGGQK